ncbi:MAG: GNAT family N-acetyltransferase [Anaerolineales bacterium]|nr:GNAT family N-acetyltransferase [Anaerolineales bacterium]MBS3752677.1 GNAT family N-acetyltransferase [Anaerolineales bacterium]
MSEIEVHPVRSNNEENIFLTFPWKVYQGDPLWVPPLLPERKKVIDPERGVFFDRGEAEFFIAWKNGEPRGTICAAVDPPTNRRRGSQECVFGFFEYLPEYDVFRALVERAAAWARDRGLDTLYGPWNLDYEDSYGVLINGRDRPPALMCGHSPPYYQEYMERCGFVPARAQNVALGIDLSEHIDRIQRAFRVAERLKERKEVQIRNADFDAWEEEIDRIHFLLDHALAHLGDHVGWRRERLASTLEPFRKIADPELILFADLRGKTVGFLPALPNLNEVLIHVNGLRYPWDYLKLGWWMIFHPPKTMTVKSMLVLPEYWNTGVAVMLYAELLKRILDKGYTWLDLSITSLDNPTSVLLAENHGAEIYKRWQVYHLPI